MASAAVVTSSAVLGMADGLRSSGDAWGAGEPSNTPVKPHGGALSWWRCIHPIMGLGQGYCRTLTRKCRRLAFSTLAIKCLVSDMGPHTRRGALISIIHHHFIDPYSTYHTPSPHTTQGLWVVSTVRSVGIWALWRCGPDFWTCMMVSGHKGTRGIRWINQTRR